MNARDDFSSATKRILADRVNSICSNPNCKCHTFGPNSDPNKSSSIGVAAHISAAAPGGKRYDPSLTAEERADITNGIWLCHSCSKLIDTDDVVYSVEVLEAWKSKAEATASMLLQGKPQVSSPSKSVLVNAALLSQLEVFSGKLSKALESELEEIRDKWRQGNYERALSWVENCKRDSSWPVLAPETKSKLLRFEATLAIDLFRDVKRATLLADEAHAIAPTENESRLRAIIAVTEQGPEAALKIIETETDYDAVTLRAAIHLHLGNVELCQSTLNSDELKLNRKVETQRLLALSFLLAKDLNRAQLEIKKAIEIEPKWTSVKYANAVIDYFSALSPIAVPDHIPDWPAPSDGALVKHDDASASRLKAAQNAFSALADQARPASNERQSLETWFLGSLLNDPEREDEAVDYCNQLIQKNPTHYQAIAWNVAKNLQIDVRQSISALTAMAGAKRADIPHILALASCHLKTDNPNDAITLLTDCKALFEEKGCAPLWKLWMTQAIAASGESKKTLDFLGPECDSPELRNARSIALLESCENSKDWRPLIEHLEKCYLTTKQPMFLLQCCELKATVNEWQFIVENSTILLSMIGTPKAIHLAAIAAYNTRQFRACLTIIDSNSHVFPNKAIPSNLKRVYARCLEAEGILSKAISNAEVLANDEPTSSNFMELIRIYFKKGDMKGLALAAQRLLRADDATTEQLLGVCSWVQLEDRALAIELWRRASKIGIPDQSVVAGIMLGYQLELQQEMQSILERMAKLGSEGKGGVRIATLDDMVEMIKQRKKNEAELNEFYRKGKFPIHVIAASLQRSLAELYDGILSDVETDNSRKRKFRLLVRHGGRALVSGFPSTKPTWRINADSTGLLLAEHFQILDSIEQAFGPIRIPAALVPALVKMREAQSHRNPQRLRCFLEIKTAISEKRINVLKDEPLLEHAELIKEVGYERALMLVSAQRLKGSAIDFVPIMTLDLHSESKAAAEFVSNCVVNCRGVIDWFQQNGPLSKHDYEVAIENLGTEGNRQPHGTIRKGGKLLCNETILTVLFEAGLLKPFCEKFEVTISGAEAYRINEELYLSDRMQRTSEFLDTLVGRISRGIDSALYELIPETQKGKNEHSNDLDSECLKTLLEFPLASNDVLWFDERWFTSYERRDTAIVIGINEILKAVVAAKTLTIESYYDTLRRMKASGLKFLPVQTDELLFHIEQAHIVDNEIVETDALKTIRQYIADCFVTDDIFQRPPLPDGSPNVNGEIYFINSIALSVSNAMTSIWMDNDDVANKIAKADWIFDNLFLAHVGLYIKNPEQITSEDDKEAVAVMFAALVVSAVGVNAKRDGGQSRRQQYLQWLFHSKFGIRFRSNPLLLKSVCVHFKNFVLRTRQNLQQKIPNAKLAIDQMLRHYIHDLPNLAQEELQGDAEFMRQFNLEIVESLGVEDLRFRANEFMDAAESAINGRDAVVKPIGSVAKVFITRVEDPPGHYSVAFRHPLLTKLQVIDNPLLELLIESPSKREEAFRRNRHWADCGGAEFDRIVADIVSMENGQQRVKAAEALKSESPTVFYSDLYSMLCKNQYFEFTDLLPKNVLALLKYFRIDADCGDDFPMLLEGAAGRLIREEGLFSAIIRLGAFPVPLPSVLISEAMQLAIGDRRALIKRLLREIASPIWRFHFAFLLNQMSRDMPALKRLARKVVYPLLNDSEHCDLKGLLAILNWAYEEFSYGAETQNLSQRTRLLLTWGHASLLWSAFGCASVSPGSLTEHFQEAKSKIPFRIFDRANDRDICNPRLLTAPYALMAGLAYSFWSAEFVVPELTERVVSGLFMDPERIVPVIQLFRDSSIADNVLCSFLEIAEEKLESIVGSPLRAFALTSEHVQNLLQKSLESNSDGSDDNIFWPLAWAILGDSIPPEAIRPLLIERIMRTEYEKMVEHSFELVNISLNVSTHFLRSFKVDSVRERLKLQLVKVAEAFSRLQIADEDALESRAFVLFEAARNIAVTVPESGNAVMEFSRLTESIITAWPESIGQCRRLIERLVQTLPIVESRNLWKLLVRLRSESP